MGAGIAAASVVYFNTPPTPHPQAQVGNVVVDLEQLDYRLTYEDLQSAGLFTDVQCRRCQFERGGTTVNLDDFDDPTFMATLLRYRGFVYLNFYSADGSAGAQRFDEVARTLRKRYPGRSKAIRMFRGEEEITAE